jgi:GH43 family beta-xylosidase
LKAASIGESPASAPCTFSNPIARGADPWVEFRDGYYYMAQSRNPGGQRSTIWVFRSPRLTDLRRDSVLVWTAPDTGWDQTHVWAPEIRRLDGHWLIYYAAGRPGPAGAPFVFQRSGVLRALGDDPQGAWEDLGQLDTGGDPSTRADDDWAIDLTVHRIRDQLYAVWSGWAENTLIARTPQHLYIARMSDPWTISSPRVLLSSPTEAGHNGFAKSPDGTEDWIIYHAKADTLPGWNRVIHTQPFTWHPDGSPEFGEPVAAGVALPVPSGEPCEAAAA